MCQAQYYARTLPMRLSPLRVNRPLRHHSRTEKSLRAWLAPGATAAANAIETVATILEHDCTITIQDWLARVDGDSQLARVSLNYEQRTGHLPHLFGELVVRLRQPHDLGGKRVRSQAAVEHGRVRRKQGYTADMMIEESRMLQVSIFQTLQNNLHRVDVSLLLIDVMTIADEVDWQLTQAMRSYMETSARVQRATA
jgi:uncharacterized protein (DUF952 family)